MNLKIVDVPIRPTRGSLTLGASDTGDTSSRLVRVAQYSHGVRGTGNVLLHGDNLNWLRLVAKTSPSSVKCAYLDPPYNNGETYQHYLDRMGHEEWLQAVTSRLEYVRTLLRPDGSLWISIDDSELHYLKVEADRVFGRDNFIGTIVWERRTTRENRKAFSRNHEYLLVYAKDAAIWTKVRNALPSSPDLEARYRNLDGDPRGPWQSVSANVQDGHATPAQFYALEAPTGQMHYPPKGRCWVYTWPRMREEIANNRVWFGRSGNGVPRLKRFLSDRQAGLTPATLWGASEVGSTSEAKKELLNIFHDKTLFDTPKPERLLHRILQISTNPGDVVLDPYLGSATTAAVAHKTGRTYIGIENGAHIKSHCFHRLRRVVEGENGGISRAVNWQGGGGFDFFRFDTSRAV